MTPWETVAAAPLGAVERGMVAGGNEDASVSGALGRGDEGAGCAGSGLASVGGFGGGEASGLASAGGCVWVVGLSAEGRLASLWGAVWLWVRWRLSALVLLLLLCLALWWAWWLLLW